MNEIRSKRSARVLPEATTLIPMETQAPKGVRSGGVFSGWKIQPNPLSDDFRQFVLLR
jgi:hypothetical protein